MQNEAPQRAGALARRLLQLDRAGCRWIRVCGRRERVRIEPGVAERVGGGSVARRGAARVQQSLRRLLRRAGTQEIKETLGSGAYSVVYAAVDKQTHQRYAVKCIKKRDLQKSDVQSLKNEVFIMGQVGARSGREG